MTLSRAEAADSSFEERGERTLGCGPAGKTASKLNTNDLGGLKLPGETSHDIDGISSADTNGGHTETTGVGSVRVGTDHKTTGESVVFEDNLVNDARTGLPELDTILACSTLEEIENFLVGNNGAL